MTLIVLLCVAGLSVLMLASNVWMLVRLRALEACTRDMYKRVAEHHVGVEKEVTKLVREIVGNAAARMKTRSSYVKRLMMAYEARGMTKELEELKRQWPMLGQ